MSAQLAANSQLGMLRPPSGRAEHISLESEPDAAPEVAPADIERAVHATYTLHMALRRRSTQISLLEDHFVAVRSLARNTVQFGYVLDLRFVNHKPVTTRHIAWRWLAVALAWLTAGAAVTWFAPRPWQALALSPAFGIALVCLLAGIGALLKFARDTSESLQFLSEHGGAVLIDITGPVGSTRKAKRFFVEMIKAIRAAKQARPQPKAQWLRDEMREHHRLRELQVLSEADYEASKVRILKSHS